MKKLITAVLLTAFCLQTAGCCAQTATIPVPTVSAGNQTTSAQTTAQTQAIASQTKTNAETKTTQSARTTKMKDIGSNPTSIKITGSMTKEQKKEAFKQILKAKGIGYIDHCIADYIQWDIIDENTIQDTLTFIDLLKEQGYSEYSIRDFLYHQKKITNEEFKQICENIVIISGGKYGLSPLIQREFIIDLPWDNFSKPISESFFKLIDLLDIQEFHFGELKIFSMFMNDEKITAEMLETYNLMKQNNFDKVTRENIILNRIIRAKDWRNLDKINADLKSIEQTINILEQNNIDNTTIQEVINSPVRLMSDQSYYIIHERLTTLKNIEQLVDFMKKNNFDNTTINLAIKNSILNSNDTTLDMYNPDETIAMLKNIELIVNFMKQNNYDEKEIINAIQYADFAKTEETLGILKILIQQKRTVECMRFCFERQPDITYRIYESVTADNSIKDKNKEFIKQIKKEIRKKNSFIEGLKEMPPHLAMTSLFLAPLLIPTLWVTDKRYLDKLPD